MTAIGPARPSQPPFYSRWSYPPRVTWSVATYGTDSFDVADVTVTCSFLTPQR